MIDRVCAAAFTQKRPRPAYPDREDWTSRSLDKRHNGLRAIPLVSLTTIHGQRRRVAVAGDDAVTGRRGYGEPESSCRFYSAAKLSPDRSRKTVDNTGRE